MTGSSHDNEPADEPPSGADLARRALAVARADAARRRHAPQPAPPIRARRGTTGRDVVPLGQVLARLTEELDWTQSVAGSDVVERWPHLVGPELAERVRATGFDNATGTLHLATDSPAHAANLRLQHGAVVDWINRQIAEDPKSAATPTQLVRSLDIACGNRRTGQAR